MFPYLVTLFRVLNISSYAFIFLFCLIMFPGGTLKIFSNGEILSIKKTYIVSQAKYKNKCSHIFLNKVRITESKCFQAITEVKIVIIYTSYIVVCLCIYVLFWPPQKSTWNKNPIETTNLNATVFNNRLTARAIQSVIQHWCWFRNYWQGTHFKLSTKTE